MDSLEDLAIGFGSLFLRYHRLMDRRMTAEGASLAQTKLLMFLHNQDQPARAADIAEFFGQAPRTVTGALDVLERDGMLQRQPDPHDRRAKRLSLTDSGRAAMQATEPMRRAMIDQIFGALDADERQQLESIIDKLAERVAEQEQDGICSLPASRPRC